MTDKDISNQRRSFLIQAAGLTAAGSLLKTNTSAGAATPAATVPDSAADAASPPYQSLSLDEAAFVEALVNVMCPADHLTPERRRLRARDLHRPPARGRLRPGRTALPAGPWKKGKPQFGYQLPLTPEQFFKAGLAAANAACASELGKHFDALAPADAGRRSSRPLARGKRDRPERRRSRCWFNELVYPLFVAGLLRRPDLWRQSQ